MTKEQRIQLILADYPLIRHRHSATILAESLIRQQDIATDPAANPGDRRGAEKLIGTILDKLVELNQGRAYWVKQGEEMPMGGKPRPTGKPRDAEPDPKTDPDAEENAQWDSVLVGMPPEARKLQPLPLRRKRNLPTH